MYIYEDIGFRPIEFEDLEILRRLHNDMSTLLQLGSVEMFTAEEQENWWKSLSRNRRVQRHSIVKISENKVVGICKFQVIDHINRNCEIGVDIFPAFRGKGFGKKSYQMILEYLFMHFNMHMVYLRVGDFNLHAKKLYESIGFVETGRFKEYLYRDGRYWDYILMTLTMNGYMTKFVKPTKEKKDDEIVRS